MLTSKAILAASAMVLAMAVPAMAQTVLTVSSEQTTTWVRNFNPFGQTSLAFRCWYSSVSPASMRLPLTSMIHRSGPTGCATVAFS